MIGSLGAIIGLPNFWPRKKLLISAISSSASKGLLILKKVLLRTLANSHKNLILLVPVAGVEPATY